MLPPPPEFSLDDDDLVEETIEDVPTGVNDCLEPADIEALDAVGMTVYIGDEPPDVTGEYLLDSLEITWDETVNSGPIMPYGLVMTNQTPEGTLDQSLTATSDLKEGGGEAFIAGSGDCFTVFVCFEGLFAGNREDCWYWMPQLLSGCVSEPGLVGLQWGYRMDRLEGNCEGVVRVGHRRVMEETDGLAERQGRSI